MAKQTYLGNITHVIVLNEIKGFDSSLLQFHLEKHNTLNTELKQGRHTTCWNVDLVISYLMLLC